MEAACLVILQDVPDLPTEHLAMDFGVWSQARLESGETIPGRA